MTVNRQERAKSLANRFRTGGRKPVVLEFAGVPKAGKTTTLAQLQSFLKRCGFKVEVVVERASVCPIRDKKHSNFNVWTACTTLAQLLEKTQSPPRQDDPDVLILDRGLFDSLCWLRMMEQLSRLRSEDLQVIERFLRVDDWRKRISAVFLMTAKPEDSLSRERGHLPVDDAIGSIMNKEVLAQMLNNTLQMAEGVKNEFRVFQIDTSSKDLVGNVQLTTERVADLALDVIEEQLREEILHVPTDKLLAAMGGKSSVQGTAAKQVVACFAVDGGFRPRDEVEADAQSVQALPIIVVRTKAGEILLLKRREANEKSPLHEKLVIWAGGHVRIEDGKNGSAILRGAVRELQEELRLSVEPDELSLLGCLYLSGDESSRKHCAIVFEWRAETDDVAVAISNSEFFERRGTSLSGRFVSVEELFEQVKSNKLTEAWSTEILREFYAKNDTVFSPRLI